MRANSFFWYAEGKGARPAMNVLERIESDTRALQCYPVVLMDVLRYVVQHEHPNLQTETTNQKVREARDFYRAVMTSPGSFDAEWFPRAPAQARADVHEILKASDAQEIEETCHQHLRHNENRYAEDLAVRYAWNKIALDEATHPDTIDGYIKRLAGSSPMLLSRMRGDDVDGVRRLLPADISKAMRLHISAPSAEAKEWLKVVFELCDPAYELKPADRSLAAMSLRACVDVETQLYAVYDDEALET